MANDYGEYTGVDTGRYVTRYLPKSTYLPNDLPTYPPVWSGNPGFPPGSSGDLFQPRLFFFYSVAPPLLLRQIPQVIPCAIGNISTVFCISRALTAHFDRTKRFCGRVDLVLRAFVQEVVVVVLFFLVLSELSSRPWIIIRWDFTMSPFSF